MNTLGITFLFTVMDSPEDLNLAKYLDDEHKYVFKIKDEVEC